MMMTPRPRALRAVLSFALCACGLLALPALPASAQDPAACAAACVQRNQMKAVAAEQIEAECRASCGLADTTPTPDADAHPPAGHVAHPAMHHQPEEGCPLQAAGVNPDHLRPFHDTAQYIAHLDRADRAAWQKPEALIAALALPPNAVVADLGAGSGYFTFRVAAGLPGGRVVALDVDPEMVRHVHHKAMTEAIPNVQAKLADPTAPTLPPDTTHALVVDVLHHVPNPPAWVAHVAGQLQPGAQLVIVEFRMGDVPVGPPDKHKIAKERLLEMAQAAGLTLAADHDAVLPYQHLLVFEKPAAP